MKQLYIFDFDGTLADTLPLCFMCFRETFLKYNQQYLTDKQIARYFGGSEQQIIEQIVQGSPERKQQAVEFFYKLYFANHPLYATCPPAIFQLLQQLKQQQKTLAIFTGKGRRSLEYSLDALKLREFFDVTISDDEVENSKPAPDGLLQIVEQFQIDKAKAVYFGDSQADLISGQQAGIETYLIDWITKPTDTILLPNEEHTELV